MATFTLTISWNRSRALTDANGDHIITVSDNQLGRDALKLLLAAIAQQPENTVIDEDGRVLVGTLDQLDLPVEA